MGIDSPPTETNLVWKAAIALAKAAEIKTSAHINLIKRLPIGAGLGGGSSDAASTLLALNQGWGLNWPADRLAGVAAELGSDVPLFVASSESQNPTFAGRQFIIRGRGERVQRLPGGWQGWVVVVVPDFGLATAEVYRRWTILRASGPTPKPWESLPCNATELARRLFNDLEPAATSFEPRLMELHRKLDMLGGRPVRMTGSGSCLYSIMDTQADAEAWKELARQRIGAGGRLIVALTL
jgi:4-diphosphocytidyl-2-C-methyl-D-erythritol kinase